ncbi:MAG TPA: glycosyltransferase 87 family protein [Terriglobales bacterium]|nr:glycosyltransferase 87 family protein [Terriglobales bacterium]
MSIRNLAQRGFILRFVWVAALLSLAGLILSATKTEPSAWLTPGRAWDVDIYYRAMQAVRAGQDPYATGLARQIAAEATGHHAFTYVYPPLTLLALRAANLLPLWLAAALYWISYSAAFIGIVWAATQSFHPPDRDIMQYAVPLAIFFPGLMPDDVILSGNIAYIFYGLIFTAAVLGWRRGVWRWFYLAVLVAACFKLPFLTLLAIPPLAGDRQWLKATGVGAAGVGLFAVQYWLWPVHFREYLQSVSLQFQFNGDFGLSPAGTLGRFLYERGLPYSAPSTLAFLIYGSALCATLYVFSIFYRERRISAESWVPVLLVGTILLNPRIMQYDAHAIALPMALIVARSMASRSKAGIAVAVCVLLSMVAGFMGNTPASVDRTRSMFVLIAVMALGFQQLAMEARRTRAESLLILPDVSATSEPALVTVDAYQTESGN